MTTYMTTHMATKSEHVWQKNLCIKSSNKWWGSGGAWRQGFTSGNKERCDVHKKQRTLASQQEKKYATKQKTSQGRKPVPRWAGSNGRQTMSQTERQSTWEWDDMLAHHTGQRWLPRYRETPHMQRLRNVQERQLWGRQSSKNLWKVCIYTHL